MGRAGQDTFNATMADAFVKGIKAFRRTSLSVHPREELEGVHCRLVAVYRPGGDVILQVFPKGKKATDLLTDEKAGGDFLAGVVEDFFGATDRFAAAYTAELSSWGILARGLSDMLSFDREHHVHGFAARVDQAIAEHREGAC